MRLLLDQNRSRRVAALLRDAGHDVAHVAERGMATAHDDVVFAAAAEVGVLVSEDTDFGALLAQSGGRTPSFVLLRTVEPLRPEDQATLLIANSLTLRASWRRAPSSCSAVDACAFGPFDHAAGPTARSSWYRPVRSGAVTFRSVRSRQGHAGHVDADASTGDEGDSGADQGFRYDRAGLAGVVQRQNISFPS